MFKKVLFLVFIFVTSGFTQVVYTDPPFATRLDSFTVIFDATKGNGGLAGYSGTDVYAHTGVTIEGEGTWKYVSSTWGTADSLKFKLSKIGTDLWKLVIGNPYDYYHVPLEKKITQLSFVFRNTSGNVSGRDVGGADIFMDLYEPGLTILFSKPDINTYYGDSRRSPVFIKPDSSLEIQAVAAAIGTKISAMQLFRNGEEVITEYNDTLNYVFSPYMEYGLNIFKVIGTDTSGLVDSSQFAVMINGIVDDEARPEGVEDGINYINDSTVVLSLMAPYKDFVYLIGDFNDWLVDEEYFLKRDVITQSDVHWWIELTRLTAGQEYAFQYLVDGDIRIADPLTHKILHKDDANIPAATYPGLKTYPDDKTDNAVAILQTAQTQYPWQVNDFQPSAQEELVIYELLVRDFIATHDYKTLKDTLDYLQNLGVNAIELMPVNEFENNESWGYNTSFLIALDKYYGPPDDLKAFIDACHSRGIAVIMDIVLNHHFGQSPLVQLYLDYYGTDEIIMKLPNPWFNRMSPDLYNKYGADFNHSSSATRYLVDRTVKHWLTEFRFDGFRFDYTKGFTNKVGDGWAYDPSRISNLKRMANYIWSVNPKAYVICENWAENSEEKELAEYGMMLWGHPNSDKDKGYYEAAMGYHDGDKSDFSWGYYKNRDWNVPHLVTKIESHDEERLMYKNLTWGNSSGSYDITNLTTALQRMKAVAAFYFTIPGPKLFWQFMELGYDYSIDYNGRTGNKPIRWNYLQNDDRRRLFNTFKALLQMRKENGAFRDSSSVVNMSVRNAVKRITIEHDSLKVSIIGNFGVTASSIDPMFYTTGTWYDFFSGDSITVSNINTPIALDAGEFHIYTDKKLNSPEVDPVTSIRQISENVPMDFKLNQNFPNPFNPQTTIGYQLPVNARVVLKIFDINGREVETLLNEPQSAGVYQVTINAQQWASGIYFYTLKAGKFQSQKKMILIK